MADYQKEINYFYEVLKANKGPLEKGQIDEDISAEDSQTLEQLAENAPEGLDLDKVNEIRDYLIHSDYLVFPDTDGTNPEIDENRFHMTSPGFGHEKIKEDLETHFMGK